MAQHRATYSPEDNKLRIYLSYRLPADEYAPIKAAGYHSAPRQGCVFAVWSPAAEDMAMQLCEEIEDEDKTLTERAEERAERFEEYQENRRRDSEAAHQAVKQLADGIPLGQPILVGHHSERHARRDAERIESGMRKAVKMWETSQYWAERAAGAIANAKYKERPDVRARRIKTIEADIRRMTAAFTPDPKQPHIMQHRWNESSHDAPTMPHAWCTNGTRGGHWVAVEDLPRIEAGYKRSIEHCNRRLEYERAMLKNEIGVESFSELHNYQVGGRVHIRGAWLTITKLNKKAGEVVSVSTNNTQWPRVVSVEDIGEYAAPTLEQAATAKAAVKRPKLCNYPGDKFVHWTQEQWDKLNKDYKTIAHVIEATETHARHCVRWALSPYTQDNGIRCHTYQAIFITDAKRVDPPAASPDDPTLAPVERAAPRPYTPRQEEPAPFDVDSMKQVLKEGVQVVTAPQLFPTPPAIARQVVDLVGDCIGKRILEPSAGTGNLVRAVVDSTTGFDCVREVVALDISSACVDRLEDMRSKYVHANSYNFKIHQRDFLDCPIEELGTFDRIVMNPPFDGGADIKHIQHAMKLLKPGGRLVAVCANGPRQQEKLKPIASEWVDLPAGSFQDSGTMANTAIVVYERHA